MLAPALIISLFSGVALCKLYDDVADLPSLQYDFVIVGGGTAGNVVASRLTENPNVSVLVLEAGESNEGLIDSEVPFLTNGIVFPDNPYSWNYTTTPQTGLNGRVVEYLQGHLLGGCSSHNGMAYTRGAAADFDRYAQLTRDPGWSWNEIFPYFLKSEKWTPPADQHDTHEQFNPRLHGRDGPISVSLTGFAWPELERRVINTTKELPNDFPFNVDMNSGQPLGIGWLQSTIGHGMRSSSATGYLKPTIMQRSNLDVLLHAQVAKLVNVTQRGGSSTFGGVQFRCGTSLFVARASKEIIISAGTIGTPHLLLNSGIGDPSTLKALGMQAVVDLPGVGKNASDHAYFQMTWAVNSNQTTESITQNVTRFNEAFAEWNASHTGPFVDPSPGTHVGWLRLSTNSSAFDVHSDPSPGPGAPHLEVLFMPTGMGAPGNFISLTLGMVSPVSRGSVSINSSDPFAPALVDPGLLTSDFDTLALMEGIKLALKFVGTPAWHGFLGAPTINLAVMSPSELEATIRANASPGFHIVGTAAMSPTGSDYGVVDPNLKVKGVDGLRVIDASVLPIVPGAHTQAAAYVIAERGADLVKQQWT